MFSWLKNLMKQFSTICSLILTFIRSKSSSFKISVSFWGNEGFALYNIIIICTFYLIEHPSLKVIYDFRWSSSRLHLEHLWFCWIIIGVQDYILNTFVFLEFRIILLLLLLLLLLLPLFAFTVSQKLLHGLLWNFIYILINYKRVADRNIVDLDQWPWPLQL